MPQRQPIVCREPLQALHFRLAELPLRDVDHPLQRQIVVSRDQGQIRQRVTDLHPVVEARAAVQGIRDACLHQRLLDKARHEPGAVQNRHVPIRCAGFLQPLDLLREEFALLALSLRVQMHHRRAIRIGRIQRFFDAVAVVVDEGIGDAQDIRR